MHDEASGFVPVPAAGPGIDPRVALATSVHAAPGIYAVLVGSGMSSAAGIPTGWQVVEDLVRKVARAERIPGDELGDAPEAWWEAQGRGEPKYDQLLDALAPTPAARQAVLRGYFDPPPPVGPSRPTAGHSALASLCAQGQVRVVMTTNFDRLIERALEEAGASPQVISTVDGIKGMTPLPHARTTVIKLHGDYESSDMRNTREELAEYPQSLRQLLDRVLDEYGLLVIGWSAEHDTALADAVVACPSRRYPTYWAAHAGHIGETAQRLISVRQAAVMETPGADELLCDLVERVTALERRAARRQSPHLLRLYKHPPGQSQPSGWVVRPLLQLRAVAALAPAPLDLCGLISPEQRRALLEALRKSAITGNLSMLAKMPAATVPIEGEQVGSMLPASSSAGSWQPTPGGYQSASNASYRVGRRCEERHLGPCDCQLPDNNAGRNRVVLPRCSDLSEDAASPGRCCSHLARRAGVDLTTHALCGG